jgi:Fe-S cluster assembly iron-binding protein IscA
MLTVTRTAAAALVDSRERQGLARDASLRVAAAPHSAELDGDAPGITLAFVDEPSAGDQIGTVHGLTLCIAPEVAETLADAAIDVEDEADGNARLVLVEPR